MAEDNDIDGIIEGFGLNDFAFEATGILGKGLIDKEANKNEFKLQMMDLNSQLETIELNFIEEEALRLDSVAKTISNINAGASRRGLATGQETSTDGALKRSEVQANENKINYLNQQRGIIFQQEVAKANQKQQDKNDLFGMVGNLSSAFINNMSFDKE